MILFKRLWRFILTSDQSSLMLPKHLFCLSKISLLILIIFCTSCDNVQQDEPDNFDFIDEAQKTVIVELIVNDLESLVLNSMINLDLQDPGGTVETHVDVSIFSVRGNCGREIDTDQNRITIDLGSCIDHFEILRGGIVTIDYSDSFDQPGNIISVSLSNYQYENISITGAFSILNTSESDSEVRNYEITFPETSLNLENNEDSFIFSGSRAIEVFEQPGSFRDPNVLSLVNASWNIMPVTGNNFEIATTTKLLHRIDCWSDGFYFPRSGIQEVLSNDSNFTIDYGKNNCGWELTLAFDGQEAQQYTLQELFNN
ncbi:MAG: hypothetical protein ACJAVN_002627 [Roseivirga sp.]